MTEKPLRVMSDEDYKAAHNENEIYDRAADLPTLVSEKERDLVTKVQKHYMTKLFVRDQAIEDWKLVAETNIRAAKFWMNFSIGSWIAAIIAFIFIF